nr:MAG TPA: hypothetical protein [Caudoviricetes sp.]
MVAVHTTTHQSFADIDLCKIEKKSVAIKYYAIHIAQT